ncbi:MAG: hypothetical protein EXQ91_08900 [Alphaproteobacteria bacterium]|nr:hypothetical protein [Alphaproteobacteria bacterium]
MEGVRTVAGYVLGGLGVAWLSGLALVGALFLSLFPDSLTTALRAIRLETGPVLGFGLIAIFAAPTAILFLFVTLFGIPLAILALAAFLAALFLGYLMVVFFVGDRCLWLVGKGATTHCGLRFLSFVIALFALEAASSIPFVGWMLMFFVLALGFGTWLYVLGRNRLTTRPT